MAGRWPTGAWSDGFPSRGSRNRSRFHAALRQRLAGQQQIDAQPTVIVEAFGAVIKPREMLMIVGLA